MTAWFVSPQGGKKFGGLANMGGRKETNMAVTGLVTDSTALPLANSSVRGSGRNDYMTVLPPAGRMLRNLMKRAAATHARPAASKSCRKPAVAVSFLKGGRMSRTLGLALTVLGGGLSFAQSMNWIRTEPLRIPTTPTGFGSILFPGTGTPPPGQSGFGNVLFPGTGSPPPGNIIDPTFAGRLHATVSGYPPYLGVAYPGHGRRGHGAVAGGYPIAYPVYVGSGYSYYPELASPVPPVTVINEPAPPPQIIIHQTFLGQPGQTTVTETAGGTQESASVRVYTAPAAVPEAARAEEEPVDEEETTVYYLAFRDHLIEPAVGYWVDGETLHYITTRNKHRAVPMDKLDRATTNRLNRNRGVLFESEGEAERPPTPKPEPR